MFTIGKSKVNTNWHAIFAVVTYTAIKLTAFVCSTIIAINVHWLLGSALFAFALLVRFEFYVNPKLESGLTQRAPDGLTPEQIERIRQMIQNAIDTGSA